MQYIYTLKLGHGSQLKYLVISGIDEIPNLKRGPFKNYVPYDTLNKIVFYGSDNDSKIFPMGLGGENNLLGMCFLLS